MKNYVRVSDILARLQNFSQIDAEVLEAKAIIGTNVHKAIDEDIQGNFPMLNTERERAYFFSYEMFKEEYKPNYLMTEARLFDDELMITGQLDGLIQSDQGPILIDYKTSASPNKKIWNMQAHFYHYLLRVNNIKVGDKMLWINLRHKKSPVLNDDGEAIFNEVTGQVFEWIPVKPLVVTFLFDPNVLQQCIDEANKFWDERFSNVDVE